MKTPTAAETLAHLASLPAPLLFNPADFVVTVQQSDHNYLDDPDAHCLDVVVTTTLPVDRPHVAGWGLGHDTPRVRRLAARLKAAIEAGRVLPTYIIKTDVHGRTYVSAINCVHGRYLNNNLKSLGF